MVYPKILIVDDDKDLLEMVSMILTLHHYQTICISDGMELQTILKKQRPDLILMDVFLGNQDGRLLCKQLRLSSDHAETPVVLYSANDISTSSIIECRANSFVRKPFNITDLVQTLKTALPAA